MTTITTRAGKGSPLSNTECDNNFLNLNTAKLELGQAQSSGTANGVLYLNGSKQVASGSGLTFDGTNLAVSNGSIQVANAKEITWGGIYGAGIPTISASAAAGISFYPSGSTSGEQMRLTSTGLGIGTSSPGAKLDVNGSVKATAENSLNLRSGVAATRTYIGLGTTSGSVAYIGLAASGGGVINGSAAGDLEIASDSGKINFSAGVTRASISATLDSSGNLGLGVTPSAWGANVTALDMPSGASFFSGAYLASLGTIVGNNVYNNAGNKYKANGYATQYAMLGTDGSHRWYTAPSGTAGNPISFTQAMTLNASGNLGVGVTSPNYKVHVGNGTESIALSPTTGTNYIGSISNTPLAFIVNATERMRIDSSGNVGIGTSSPSVKLHVSSAAPTTLIEATGTSDAGVQTKTSLANFKFGAGIGSATNCWNVYDIAASAERMRIDASGNLGIGTSSPSAKLDVAGNIYLKQSTYAATTRIGFSNPARTGDAAYIDYIGNGDFTGQIAFGVVQSSSNTAATEAMRIDSRGNLGLGVTPSAWQAAYKTFDFGSRGGLATEGTAVQLSLNGYYNAGWKYKQTAAASFYEQYNGTHAWYTAPSGTAGNAISFTQAMTLDASGNLGIGTTSPTSASGYTFITLQDGGTNNGAPFESKSGAVTLRSYASGANALGVVGTFSNHALIFTTNSAERARIDSSGSLLVGTTSTNGILTVQSGSANTNIGSFSCTNTSGPNYVLSLQSTASAANTAAFIRAFNSTSTLCFNVAGNGNVTNTNNSYGAISDIKLKENIVDATPKLDNLCKVRVVNYNLIGDYEQHKQIGVIAQEVEQIFPGIVEESPDRDAEGNDLGTTTKAVKYSVFVPMLIKAVQEQQAIINAQASALESLTSRIAALEAK